MASCHERKTLQRDEKTKSNACMINASKGCSKMPLSFSSAAEAAPHPCLQPFWEGSVKQKEGVFDLYLSERKNTEELSVYHVDLISMTLNHSFGKHEK